MSGRHPSKHPSAQQLVNKAVAQQVHNRQAEEADFRTVKAWRYVRQVVRQVSKQQLRAWVAYLWAALGLSVAS